MTATPTIITYSCSTLTALCVSLLTWLLLQQLADMRLATEEKVVRKKTGRFPILFKAFMPMARRLAPALRRPDIEPLRARTDSRLVQAGRDQQLSPEEFIGLRLVYVVVFMALGLTFALSGLRFLVMFGLFLAAFGLTYPTLWLNGQIRMRHLSIQRALPSVLDLMTLSVEAGRDFLTALREILQHREKDALTEELERVFREVQLGKQRRHALRNMAARVQQADLTMVVETLAQADELGVSIGNILRILGDQMRQKRFQQAEKLANESPVKLLLPLFVFIFPAVIIVMMGPILMRSLHFLMK